ncbi:hypothetical protein NUU61_001352 [Penicillium alfredii]|uniref:Uncharacterized protein n=1 Tax=Penicillium alfredii TaxID=1506179 RepID=A0A9W9KN88_9EURO|nr:uncharacterized protein NUU61_001352 [Penicillium alfredii]KAJ5111722.1 hypothetical protein NUU61_001352 [Penicillium alfredii]
MLSDVVQRPGPCKQCMIVGDFNIYDPLWAGHQPRPEPRGNTEKEEQLKSVSEQHPLEGSH